MIPIDLNGKIALVTGATGELGRVMVSTLARAGADIVVHYNKNQSLAKTLVAEIEQIGQRAIAVQADVTDKQSIIEMNQEVTKRLGAPDIIVTNAVIQYDWTNILEQSPEDYESQFRSCVLQNVLMTQVFVPAMIEKRWGRLIGINTECSLQCSPTQSAYVAGKRGMDGVMRVLAKEIGKENITVNQIAPGWTASENSPENDVTQRYSGQVPLKRRGTDQEIANVVAFVASDLASFITGAFIPVCGGKSMTAI